LSEVIVKNGGGRMLEQPLLMSTAPRASTRSLSFLMAYCNTINTFKKHLSPELESGAVQFSDETQVALDHSRYVYIWRKDNEMWLPECIAKLEMYGV